MWGKRFCFPARGERAERSASRVGGSSRAGVWEHRSAAPPQPGRATPGASPEEPEDDPGSGGRKPGRPGGKDAKHPGRVAFLLSRLLRRLEHHMFCPDDDVMRSSYQHVLIDTADDLVVSAGYVVHEFMVSRGQLTYSPRNSSRCRADALPRNS